MKRDESPVCGETGRPQALTEKCGTCIFRPHDPMHLGADRVREVIQANRDSDSVLTCHQTLSYGRHPEVGQAACRGFLDAYAAENATARFVEVVMGGWDLIPPPGQVVTS